MRSHNLLIAPFCEECPKILLKKFLWRMFQNASVDIFSRTQLLTIAKKEGTQSGEKILGHAVMTSVDGVVDLARNVEKSKTSHHIMKFNGRKIYIHVYVCNFVCTFDIIVYV